MKTNSPFWTLLCAAILFVPFLPIHPFPAKDSNGWTCPDPSTDTRILYVSASGNDNTGIVYSPNDISIGNDPRHPTGSVLPFKTYQAAFQHVRNAHADWILFRRGDRFSDSIGSQIVSGRSPSEPFFIGAYAGSGASPLIHLGTNNGLSITRESPSSPSTIEHVMVQGIRFYANTRNPDDPQYLGPDGSSGLLIHAHNPGNTIRNILIEGCAFMYVRGNVIQSTGDAPFLDNIHLRRNVLLNSYAVDAHCQGAYIANVSNLLLEENIFDHNGWLIQQSGGGQADGQATMHNHNVYMSAVVDAHLIGNMFLRASSCGSKVAAATAVTGLIIRDNLYVDCETGIDACNNYHSNPYRIVAPEVDDNVFYNLGISRPTNRDLAWAIWMQGWDGGAIHNNIFLNNQSPGGAIAHNVGLRSRGVRIHNNVIHVSSSLIPIRIDEDNDIENIRYEHNRIILNGASLKRMVNALSLDGIQFEHNHYWQSESSAEFRVGSGDVNPTEWTATYEPTADFSEPSMPDTSRTVERYLVHLGYENSMPFFFGQCRSQDMFTWDPQFTAPAINQWIRQGFFENNPNQAPQLDPIGNQTVQTGSTIHLTIQAADSDGSDLEYSATHP